MHCLIAPTGAWPGGAPALLDPLLAKALEQPPCRPDPLDLHTPAERWLGRVRGLPDAAALPLAAWALGERERPWAYLSPLHLQMDMSQATALPPAELDLPEADSRALFEALLPLFAAQDGWVLRWCSPLLWAVSHEQLAGLQLASLARVVNRPLTPWLPQDRALRRWTNEVQMLWHTHAVNTARTAHGLRPVNSVWWWGAGRWAGQPVPCQVHTHCPGVLSLPKGAVLALAGEQQVRSFQVQARPWWRLVRPPRAAEVLASL